MGAFREHLAGLISNVAGVPLSPEFSLERPVCDGDRCVCGKRGDEIARGVHWLHPKCVRFVASKIMLARMEYARLVASGEIEAPKPRTRKGP